MEDIKYMVRVSCMTFNHAHYIEDAMNGFCMQETNFPFVCTIIDDASTDAEQDVIKNYLEEHFDLENSSIVRNEETDDYFLTFAQHKTNKNCYFAVLFLKYNHFSVKKPKMPYIEEWCDTKYVALCEGDDYWIDAQKLQKQSVFMEKNPGMSLCFTANIRSFSNGESIENRMFSQDCLDCRFEDYIVSEYDNIDTCTMMYKAHLLAQLPKWYFKVGVGDIPYKLILFSKGNVGYINDITACYRKGAASSWSVRMSRSRKMRFNNQKHILQMWKDFDDWTEKKYHRAINRKLFLLRKRHIKRETLYLIQYIKSLLTKK